MEHVLHEVYMPPGEGALFRVFGQLKSIVRHRILWVEWRGEQQCRKWWTYLNGLHVVQVKPTSAILSYLCRRAIFQSKVLTINYWNISLLLCRTVRLWYSHICAEKGR